MRKDWIKIDDFLLDKNIISGVSGFIDYNDRNVSFSIFLNINNNHRELSVVRPVAKLEELQSIRLKLINELLGI
jgi:hypothetical protein